MAQDRIRLIKLGQEATQDLTKEKALDQARLYIPFIEAYSPHLAEEKRGIANGAEISREEAYFLQIRAELIQLNIESDKIKEYGSTSLAFRQNKAR